MRRCVEPGENHVVRVTVYSLERGSALGRRAGCQVLLAGNGDHVVEQLGGRVLLAEVLTILCLSKDSRTLSSGFLSV